VEWTAFDAVVIRSCWDYHLRIDEFLAWITHLEERGVRLVNSASLIRWNADKRYLGDLSSKGIAIPQTVWVAAGEALDVALLCEERQWRRAVVKPLVSASAYRTELRTDGMIAGPMMVQEYVQQIEDAGEWSLIYFGGVLHHAVRKRPRCGDFRVQMELGGTAEAGNPPHRVRQSGDAVLAVLSVAPVIARVDLVETDREVLLMELELIEPELFLHLAPGSDRALASAIKLFL
jgi:glutathione synthase/RimK-type ligase-like ATP-grasp enzyme